MRTRLTRWSRSKGLLLAALAVTAAAFPSAAAAGDPTPQDAATASGDNLVLDDFSALSIHVDAHSGPLGESPGGSASFSAGGLLDISGPVDCLHVIGNVATLTISGPFADAPYDGFIIKLVDNGGGGLDKFQYFPTFDNVPSPIDCLSGSPIYFGGPLIGRAVVSDVASPPPSTIFTSPASGSSGVARATQVIAAFNHAMNKPSAEAAFSLRRNNGELVRGSFGWYGNALIFAPAAPLAGGAGYTARVGTGAEDIVGKHLQSPTTWQFTTAPQPLIAAVVPAENAGEVLPNANVVVAFDKAMSKPSAEAAFSLKRTSDGSSVPGSFGWYGNALIFNPAADLNGGGRYSVSVATTAKDLSGHPLPGAKSWSFNTTDRPIVDLVHPPDGTTGVPRSSVAVAFFNKTMDKPSAQVAFSLKRTSDGSGVPGSFGWYGRALIFKPNSPLAANTLFTASLSAAARDLGGRTLANPTTWHFATAG